MQTQSTNREIVYVPSRRKSTPKKQSEAKARTQTTLKKNSPEFYFGYSPNEVVRPRLGEETRMLIPAFSRYLYHPSTHQAASLIGARYYRDGTWPSPLKKLQAKIEPYTKTAKKSPEKMYPSSENLTT